MMHKAMEGNRTIRAKSRIPEAPYWLRLNCGVIPSASQMFSLALMGVRTL
jgi:hypothetical protein